MHLVRWLLGSSHEGCHRQRVTAVARVRLRSQQRSDDVVLRCELRRRRAVEGDLDRCASRRQHADAGLSVRLQCSGLMQT